MGIKSPWPGRQVGESGDGCGHNSGSAFENRAEIKKGRRSWDGSPFGTATANLWRALKPSLTKVELGQWLRGGQQRYFSQRLSLFHLPTLLLVQSTRQTVNEQHRGTNT